MHYFVYKYICDGEVIYVGKTDDIHRRVLEHASGQGIEEKFLPYLDKSDIYFHECANEVELSALERLLINQHKPKLNVVDVQDGHSTVFLEVEWLYYLALPNGSKELIEREMMLCQRNILSNETRIRHYQDEQKELRNKMQRLLPFYKYLHIHANDFALDPYGYFAIESKVLPVEQQVYIGKFLVPDWQDDSMSDGEYTRVQWSGELLQKLFAVSHRDRWIDETMDEIGEKRCQSISKKVANLRRRNTELTAKKEALRRKLYEEVSEEMG
jgi:predicted GIY-YIG superfamily endonuclease